MHRVEGFQLGPVGFGQLMVQNDKGSRHRIALPDLLSEAQEALRRTADYDVVCQSRALQDLETSISGCGVRCSSLESTP